MNVRKLLARLNPTAQRWPEKRGSISARTTDPITNEDVVGALGMVKNRLGREVLCFMWWPDGAALARKDLAAMISRAMAKEHASRGVAYQMASLDLIVAREVLVDQRAMTSEQRNNIKRLEYNQAALAALLFPTDADMRVRVRESVLDELLHPNRCPVCDGAGEIEATSTSPASMCETCNGRGIVPISDRQRGARIGRAESSYRRSWRGLYEWTYNLLSHAERSAAYELSDRLQPPRNPIDEAEDECGSDTAAFSR